MDEDAWVEIVAPKAAVLMTERKLPILAKAEAEGKFRRLVREDEIGYDTPIYKTYKNHPQWIIGKGLHNS
jgi:hypothetical protein